MATAFQKEALVRGQHLCPCQFIGEGHCCVKVTLSYKGFGMTIKQRQLVVREELNNNVFVP